MFTESNVSDESKPESLNTDLMISYQLKNQMDTVFPNEIFVNILSFLSPLENVRLMILSKDFHDLILYHVIPYIKVQSNFIQLLPVQNHKEWVECDLFNTKSKNDHDCHVGVYLFQHLVKWMISLSEITQNFYKKKFFERFKSLISHKFDQRACDCTILLFVASRQNNTPSRSKNDHYLYCPDHKCFINIYQLDRLYSDVFKTVFNPMNPIKFGSILLNNFRSFYGRLITYY